MLRGNNNDNFNKRKKLEQKKKNVMANHTECFLLIYDVT